jgi:hypothetical protein
VPQAKISSNVRYEAYSGEVRRFWMLGVCSSSAKTYVFGALVACEIKSDAARGEVADLLRARKGSSALSAFVCSMAEC